jgi:RNA polymerase sigma-70 factor (ECF subfamily)
VPAERPLSAVFLSVADSPDHLTASELESALESRLAEARATWPEVQVDPSAFVRFVAARTFDGGLEGLKTADLYVTCACTDGDSRAMLAIEARYFPPIDAALARMRLAPAAIDDVKQGLRRLLFVGDEVAPPRIAEYTGRGELRGWLRVTAVRAALKLVKKDKRETLVDEIADDMMRHAATAQADPELLYVKEVYRAQFRTAFQAALESLSDRDKNLLRQHVVDDLSIDELGALYQVHRATAARWLTSARESLLTRTRTEFMQNARISRDECDSILRMVQSQLDVTIRRRLIG